MDDGDEHDVQRTLPLAELCHKRTHGNVYFLLTFIRMIHEEDLLEFNLNVFQWRWDVAKIEHETAAAENVVELVKERMIKTTTAVVDGDSKADRLEQGNGLVTLLKVAACFGATFDPKLLFVILQRLSHFHSPEETSNINGEYLLKDRVQFLLHTAVKEHFLEKMQGKTSYSGASDPRDEKQPSETYYRWAHDKVQGR